jgi:cyclophilin family peptidyl-prolyl cis-trans isomerase
MLFQGLSPVAFGVSNLGGSPMLVRTWLTGLAMTTMLSLGAAGAVGAAEAAPDPANTLLLTLKDGVVVIELRPDLAPKHVARIKELTREGFYDGLAFHRVIDGFMAQTGDPKGNGTGGSGVKLPAEFTSEPFVRGTVGMARSQDPNSGDSQFFICFAPAPSLDGKYTVWGQVRKGMEFVDKIKRGDERRNGEVSNPDRIVRMQLASDVKP